MIDSDAKLRDWLPALKTAEWVSLDTEADSLHAYPEKLCLVQITVPAGDYLIDPLAPVNLSPLWAALGNRELVLHGADYDLRLFQRNCRFVPDAVFDTMIAARLLGCARFGLSDLVEQFLGVKLEKGPQKANWGRRPLTERMEIYACNDTRYLRPLAEQLRSQLAAKGRLEWQQQCCRRLIADCAAGRLLDENLVWRVKGSNKLDRAGLAVLRELWRWREGEAVAANRPPFFILSHEVLFLLAAAAVEGRSVEELIPRHLSPRRREGINRAVAAGLAVPKSHHPDWIRANVQRPSETVKRRFHELEKRRDHRAKELQIDPTLIAPRATLLALATDWNKCQSDLMDWQRELLVDPKRQPAGR